jgi:drug/metabolite transporter superfamily protein YnfA
MKNATLSLFGEVWMFLRERKKWWLLPIMGILLLLGALIFLAQGSAVAPFVYTIF